MERLFRYLVKLILNTVDDTRKPKSSFIRSMCKPILLTNPTMLVLLLSVVIAQKCHSHCEGIVLHASEVIICR